MEKNHIKVNDDLTLEMDGRMCMLTKNKLNNCGHCPFRKIQGCGELCRAAYYKAAETPSFGYYDAIFVEVTENKETTMEEKEPKNEPDYKALYEQEHKKIRRCRRTYEVLDERGTSRMFLGSAESG